MKNTLSVLLVVGLIFSTIQPVWAVPEKPSAPTAPVAPTQPTSPVAPDAPDQPDAPKAPPNPKDPTPTTEPTSAPANTQSTTAASSTPSPTPTSEENSATNTSTGADSTNTSKVKENSDTSVVTNNDAVFDNDVDVSAVSGSSQSSRNTGDGSVNSGEVTVLGTVQNDANQVNQNVSNTCGVCSSSTTNPYDQASNNKTGAGSTNTSNVTGNTATTILNNNTADLNNDIDVLADSGHNKARENTGDGSVETGDVNVGLTVVNTANTDIEGVGTSEFNVYDDHRGDIVVDFATVGRGGNSGASNSRTGADSTNSSSVDRNQSLTIVNDNDATVLSDVAVDAITGYNDASKNTGNGSITTGDANVVANVLNLVNNSLGAGAEILVATVNIFGNQAGDLILTDSSPKSNSCGTGCGSTGVLAATNDTTGADSFNDASTLVDSEEVYITTNEAEIGNYMNISADTGSNVANKNTGGGSVKSGDVNVTAQATTVANTTSDDTWWLVIVNEAGRWVGHIVGADGQNMASNGTIDFGAVNDGTGANSTNTASAEQTNNTYVEQNNTAHVDTNININATTGGNSANKNTGRGDIETGDVNIAANIVNFVNNNFTGGKVLVTFVNVFGDWAGNIYTPDQQKVVGDVADDTTADQVPPVGGPRFNETQIDADGEVVVLNNEIVGDEYTLYDDKYESEPTETITYVRRVRQLAQGNLSRQVNPYYGRVLGSTYTANSSTAERIRANQWLIEDDPTITVTPGPEIQAAVAYESSLTAWQWLSLAAAGMLVGAGYMIKKYGKTSVVRV